MNENEVFMHWVEIDGRPYGQCPVCYALVTQEAHVSLVHPDKTLIFTHDLQRRARDLRTAAEALENKAAHAYTASPVEAVKEEA